MTEFHLSAFSDEADSALDVQLAALKRCRISMMEIRGVNGKNVSELTDAEARETAARLKDAGVSLSAMGSPYGKYPADEPFGPHLDEFRRGLELCGILGAKYMRMFSFYVPAGTEAKAWRDTVLERLDTMLTLAEAAGVRLAHENEKGIYGDTDARCRDLKDTFGDRLDVIFDPANFVQCGVDTLNALDLLGSDITYAHIKDAYYEDGSVVPAGHGEGHVEALLRALDARGGSFCLTLEPHLKVLEGLTSLQDEQLRHRYQYPSAEAAFDAAANALKEQLQKIGYTESEAGTWIR